MTLGELEPGDTFRFLASPMRHRVKALKGEYVQIELFSDPATPGHYYADTEVRDVRKA